MAHSWHLPEMHLPEPYRHAKAWYWTAAAVGVAIVLGYLLVVYAAPMNGVVGWGPAP
jgi:hypothetical protein